MLNVDEVVESHAGTIELILTRMSLKVVTHPANSGGLQ